MPVNISLYGSFTLCLTLSSDHVFKTNTNSWHKYTHKHDKHTHICTYTRTRARTRETLYGTSCLEFTSKQLMCVGVYVIFEQPAACNSRKGFLNKNKKIFNVFNTLEKNFLNVFIKLRHCCTPSVRKILLSGFEHRQLINI